MTIETEWRPAAGPGHGAASRGLTVARLSHSFGKRKVVDEVSLAIGPGEVHCLMGPSGCGKTTTLRLIAGLDPLRTGEIRLDGETIASPGRSLPPEQRRIGMLFQDLALFPHLSVEANIAFGIRHLPDGERVARIGQLLDMVGMHAHAAKPPHQLSGGEQQRVALARALAPRPRLMLLDEAFSALDTSLRAEIRAEAMQILKTAEVPTLLVTHDPEEAIQVGEIVHVMQAGRLVQSGPVDNLYTHPASPFVADLFGPTVHFAAKVKGGLAWTPLGMIAAPRTADETLVTVVFRAEALDLTADPTGEAQGGTIVDCRRLGPACDISLRLATGATIRLRKPAETAHKIGTHVGLAVDPRYTFIFPR